MAGEQCMGDGMGRHSTFTKEIADEICDRISSGEPLAQICRDEYMPALRTVYDWQVADEEFSAGIARAREAGFDQIAMDALHIADDNGRDTRLIGPEGAEREAPDHEWISRSKLRVETRLKLLAKWDPKRYGERQLVGSDPDNPLPAGVHVTFGRVKT
jgi:hypothetical protein